MGIPYSKEINTAFVELNKAYGQVTPLVAAAYEVLETSKNITLLVAGIQVLNTIILSMVLMCMLGLLITMNPDLDNERKELVTPVMVWIAGWAGLAKRIAGTVVFLVLMMVVGGVMMTRREGKGPVESIEAGQMQDGEEKQKGEEGEEGGEGTVEKAEQRLVI